MTAQLPARLLGKICLSGRIVDNAQARIDPADRGFLLGDGVFETLSIVHGKIIDLEAHLTRLRKGAALIELPLPFADAQIQEAALALIKENQLEQGLGVLRLTVTRGACGRGLLLPEDPTPIWLLTAAAVDQLPPREMTLISASIRRNEGSPLSQIKSLNYLDNILARREAQRAGAQEALLFNGAGHLACASAANVWIVEGTDLITPPCSDGALPGIVRARVFGLAPNLGLKACEEHITKDRLRLADGFFLTNSLVGICAAVTLDGQSIAPPEVITTLQKSYDEAIALPASYILP